MKKSVQLKEKKERCTKRILMLMAALAVCGTMWSQKVFTVVYATSDDGFVNVRAQPTTRSRVLTKLYQFSHGLGQGVLCEYGKKWCKVSVGNVTGWAYTKYVGTQNWYKGDGAPRLVANKQPTTLWTDNYADAEDYNFFATVPAGTILADRFEENGDYYMLMTAHDNVYIKKTDVRVVE